MTRLECSIKRALFAALVSIGIAEAPASGQVSNQNPPPLRPTALVTPGGAVLLDDIALGGFLRACVGNNGALGSDACPFLSFSPVGLRLDPDGAAGPLVESEDVNEGFFEERWCVEHDLLGFRCNSIFATEIPGFTQSETSTPGRLQSKGVATSPDGRLRINQVTTLRSGNRCLELDVTLTNVSGGVLTNVEYLRNHDPDFGIRIISDSTTDNRTFGRPLPGSAPPMFVGATVRDFSPVETRSIGLGTSVLPPPGTSADVAISTIALDHSNPNLVLDGGFGVTRGPLVSDVGTAIAFRIASLVSGESRDLSLCYCLVSTQANVGGGTVDADLADAFTQECGVLEVVIDIKPGGLPNSVNPRSNGVIPVAILTTADFNALDVNPATVRFGPGGASEAHGKGHPEDVDRDGDLDLVLHFPTPAARIACGSTTATLTGETFAGRTIEGTDSVSTVGCR